jgi:hypothetical protein
LTESAYAAADLGHVEEAEQVEAVIDCDGDRIVVARQLRAVL